ncbi:MAG: carboxymuconolactone decarboxylase family protein [Novosphingobium sp.]
MPNPRIPPQGPDEWTDAARELFAFGEGPEAREKGSKSNVVRTFAHHPRLMLAWMKFNGRLLAAPTIPARLREIVILRLADRFKCEYEWLQHVDIARELGIGPEHFAAVKVDPDSPLWSDLERAALHAADEMTTEYRISDETWDQLAATFDHKQMLEFMFVVGVYSMLAWILSSFGAVPEPDAGKGKSNYLATSLKGNPRTEPAG